ncbi:hypothetical protein [Candidatus Bathycorpusculum sp.]|uniref:hypothetical protein n=1 Tax=Candidatus Bathycorpusculum sp. TaxID=2994959 RepID=UPI00283968EC|nr:hypothetical protein [Candidatus Termitimicrobium sp.]MCL2686097.1 hypothetical protein [Candidatus Termitimicrobium sp.]
MTYTRMSFKPYFVLFAFNGFGIAFVTYWTLSDNRFQSPFGIVSYIFCLLLFLFSISMTIKGVKLVKHANKPIDQWKEEEKTQNTEAAP